MLSPRVLVTPWTNNFIRDLEFQTNGNKNILKMINVARKLPLPQHITHGSLKYPNNYKKAIIYCYRNCSFLSLKWYKWLFLDFISIKHKRMHFSWPIYLFLAPRPIQRMLFEQQVRIQDLVKGGPASEAESYRHSEADACERSEPILSGPWKLLSF